MELATDEHRCGYCRGVAESGVEHLLLVGVGEATCDVATIAREVGAKEKRWLDAQERVAQAYRCATSEVVGGIHL